LIDYINELPIQLIVKNILLMSGFI